ncbi:MAG: hypothetical protein IJD22_03555 [Clostridia bacterium]|nr:hypothetical protein [Clostridia bacterium]
MTIGEKSAYLKGLADGLKLDTEKAEGKLIAGLLDLVADIATTVETLDEDYSELCDYVDELDSDLADLEETVYLEDEEDECLYDDEYDLGEYEDCDGECEGCCGCDYLEDVDDDDEDEDEDVFDLDEEGMRCIMCESCGDTICYDESLDPAEIICPACGKPCCTAEEE